MLQNKTNEHFRHEVSNFGKKSFCSIQNNEPVLCLFASNRYHWHSSGAENGVFQHLSKYTAFHSINFELFNINEFTFPLNDSCVRFKLTQINVKINEY